MTINSIYFVELCTNILGLGVQNGIDYNTGCGFTCLLT